MRDFLEWELELLDFEYQNEMNLGNLKDLLIVTCAFQRIRLILQLVDAWVNQISRYPKTGDVWILGLSGQTRLCLCGDGVHERYDENDVCAECGGHLWQMRGGEDHHVRGESCGDGQNYDGDRQD